VKSIVNVTTDKCYANKEWVWGYRENDSLGGYDPYSSSKACSELVTAAYMTSYFSAASSIGEKTIGIATARSGNVIGGGDWAMDRLVPDVLEAFGRGCYPLIRNPHAVRPWQHVLEPIRGYLLLAQRNYELPGEYSEAWNFGPEESDVGTVQYLVDALAELWRLPLVKHSLENNIENTKTVLHEAKHLMLNISKSRSRLKWYPLINLDQALALTIEWASLRAQGEDVRAITFKQIKDYQESLNSVNQATY
jgi:CDP-glucose 4,6-dehydratase